MSNIKNIVRLKNVPSNIIDEAIIIFKDNKKIYKKSYTDKHNGNCKPYCSDNDFLMKEADHIISNYLKEADNCKNNYEKKYKIAKATSIIVSIFFIVSIIL